MKPGSGPCSGAVEAEEARAEVQDELEAAVEHDWSDRRVREFVGEILERWDDEGDGSDEDDVDQDDEEWMRFKFKA